MLGQPVRAALGAHWATRTAIYCHFSTLPVCGTFITVKLLILHEAWQAHPLKIVQRDIVTAHTGKVDQNTLTHRSFNGGHDLPALRPSLGYADVVYWWVRPLAAKLAVWRKHVQRLAGAREYQLQNSATISYSSTCSSIKPESQKYLE